MPVIPGDNDQAMKDKLAQGAKDAEATKAERQAQASSQQQTNPVIAQDLPEAASKEELRKRAEELNKK
ncbi:Hypothetical predicted protein [Lecanosticta acicola]|uniref:Uncharacterized protein n=1 Tax=Lecanosticta acicola TaxID=111012 RepID=A0AAI8Z377_9PEZI|nr:Hypothetical predicted protein [Lecanosticta acicola]